MAVGDPKQHPEFAGTVASVDARGFWRDPSASPTGTGYHYNHNAETYMLVGDALGRAMTALQGVTMLAMYHLVIFFGHVTGFIIAASLIGFNFGGNFALFPAITSDYFGNKNVGSNYGWLFTAYGIAGIAGPQLAGYFKDSAMGSSAPIVWMAPFIIAGVACFIGALIMSLTHAPEEPSARNANTEPGDDVLMAPAQ